jgi:hypothetical protein
MGWTPWTRNPASGQDISMGHSNFEAAALEPEPGCPVCGDAMLLVSTGANGSSSCVPDARRA